MKHIAILDFGSQYTHLIARTIRELNVCTEIYPHNTPAKELKNKAEAIILSGGPQSVYGKASIKIDPKIFELNMPILGLCYGHQLIADMLGGEVKPGKVREFGRAKLHTKGKSPLFQNLKKTTQVWMSHGDSVTKLPEGFKAVGSTKDCAITAMANDQRRIYGLQFHPEVDHTLEGKTIFENFVLKITAAPQDWKVENIVDDLLDKIKKQARGKKVFVLASGGVDSNVCFTLLTKALGEKRVKGLYIDTGFMRFEESQEIIRNYEKLGLHNLETVDAGKLFYKRLQGIVEPEEKRNIIGKTFLDVKDKVSKKLKLNNKEWLLGQGTIYPDTIESGGTKHADKIKTHHNRVDAIQKMIDKGLVIEPLVEFYKHEVREIGTKLGLPQELIDRHPFPGPGLAIRCLCHNPEKKDPGFPSVKRKVSVFMKQYQTINHALLPLKSVGVQGDNRTYAHPLAVWGETNWNKLDKFASSVTNTIHGINRVILLLNTTAKKPAFFQPNKLSDLNQERIATLQEIDHIVMNIIKENSLYNEIWQFPVVLIPITDKDGRESIVLRPFNTRDVMTFTFYQMQKKIVKKITEAILATGKISYVFYDITNKPPGTTEWE
jgi:GMP synthase (glutamine-hydrolysing)